MTTDQDETFTGEYKLPVSVQHFPTMVEENYIYVDKTRYIHNLLRKGRIYFLSRPRRFGKSLLISILEEIFNGNKELFKGYWIYDKSEWKKHPVIHLDFLDIDYETLGIEDALIDKIDEISEQYRIKLTGKSFKNRFGNLIKKLSSETKKRVVVLIDEYDKPIIDYVESENMNTAEKNRKKLKNFYSVLKSQDRNIKFLFITGVSRFSRVSIFSDLNNLDDITLHPDYSKMFGYTGEEIETYFGSYIDKWIEKEGGTKAQLFDRLKDEYNGYSWDGKNFLYNPHSIHKFFDELSLGSYWFETATPNFLVKLIMEKGLYLENWENIEVRRAFFNEFNIEDININLLLFQTGYLTIKKLVDGQYTLSYPNKEVQSAFLHLLLGKYSHKKHERVEKKNISQFETITFDPGEEINPVRLERSGVIAVLNFLEGSQAMSLEINKRKEIQQHIESKIKTGKYPVHGHFIETIEDGYLFFLKNNGEFVDFCIDCNEISNQYGVFFQITADSGSFKIIENNGQVKKVLGMEMKLLSVIDRYDDKNTLVVPESFFHSLEDALTRENINTELLSTTTDNKNIYNLDFPGTTQKSLFSP